MPALKPIKHEVCVPDLICEGELLGHPSMQYLALHMYHDCDCHKKAQPPNSVEHRELSTASSQGS